MDGSWWIVLTKGGPLEKGMANHFSMLALRNPMNSTKMEKDRTMKSELLRSVGAQYATIGLKLYTVEIRGEITPETMKRQSQSKTTPTCGCDL